MSIDIQLEFYEENNTLNEQKKVLKELLIDAEKMKNEYLKGENETLLNKIKHFLGLKVKESENELLPTIEELLSRIVEENRKVGNFFR